MADWIDQRPWRKARRQTIGLAIDDITTLVADGATTLQLKTCTYLLSVAILYFIF